MNPEAVTRFIEALQPAFETGDAKAAEKTAERENVDQIRRMYESIRDGDYAAFQAFLAEDVELEMAGPPECPIAGRWKGRDQVLEATARNYGQLEDQRPEVTSVLAQGDTVAVMGRERGRIRATGREYELPWMHLFTLREGQIVRLYGLYDSQPMIAAAKADA